MAVGQVRRAARDRRQFGRSEWRSCSCCHARGCTACCANGGVHYHAPECALSKVCPYLSVPWMVCLLGDQNTASCKSAHSPLIGNSYRLFGFPLSSSSACVTVRRRRSNDLTATSRQLTSGVAAALDGAESATPAGTPPHTAYETVPLAHRSSGRACVARHCGPLGRRPAGRERL